MKLGIGIVGLPNVGKSTLFKALTKQEVNIANYPFATIEPNIGIVPVPDERLEKLAKLSNSQKIIPAVVEFYDIAGLVKGAHKGEGLGNQFLAHIRETEVIVIVLRIFQNPEIIHIENSVDPLRDFQTINIELAFKDLESIEKRLSGIEAEIRAGKKGVVEEKNILLKTKSLLDQGKLPVGTPELAALLQGNSETRNLNLLTVKRQIYLFNGKKSDTPLELIEKIRDIAGDYLVIDLTNPPEEAVNLLIKKTYEVLNLASFFTTGEKETRAWTIKKGVAAPEAAGVIHSDFQEKFIRIEVINWQKLLEAGSWVQAKQKGMIRLEGKEYIVQDGDVIIVRHG